jgi:putative transposase
MAYLHINDVFSTAPGAYFRYLTHDEDGKVAVVIALDDPVALPKQWPLAELIEATSSNRYKVRQVQGLAAAYVDPHKTDSAKRDERWNLIKDLVELPGIFNRRGRGKLIEEHAKKMGTSPQTVMTLLRAFWQGGQTKDALLTHYADGAKKRQASLMGPNAPAAVADYVADPGERDPKKLPTPRGRPRTDGRQAYYLAGEERELLAKAIRERFLNKKTVTRKKLYRSLMTDFYGYFDAAGEVKLVPPEQRPSYKQVATLLGQQLTLKELITHHTSEAEWRNNHRPITGTVLQHALHAGQVYEIDSTIVDLWLVARDDRSKIIGKATLYLVVDRFSRLIVGFHLSLDKPSWAGAMEALLSVVTDKKELCERWGGRYNPDAWVADGVLCYKLAADRGSEYIGHESDQIADDVRIHVLNMPAHMSCLKGMVECAFKLVHVSLKENAPGYEPPANAFKRHGDKCYERDASMTLDELAAEFIDIITLHNLRMHAGMRLDPELVLAKVAPIPAVVWKADVARRCGTLRRYDATFLRHKLRPAKKAVVRQDGILVNHCYYVCPEALQDEWFVAAGRKRFPIKVTYDRRSVNTIYIHTPARSDEPYPATLSPRSEYYTGYSVAEVYAVECLRKEMEQRADEHNLALEVAYDQSSGERTRLARKKTAEAIAKAKGQTSHTRAVDKRRREERERANEQAFPAAPTPTAARPVPPSPAPVARPVKADSRGVPSANKPVKRKASNTKAKSTATYTGLAPSNLSLSRSQMLGELYQDADE